MFTKKVMVMAGALIMSLGTPLYADSMELTEHEIDDLSFMREEEKMARDVYTELYQYHKEKEEDGVDMIILANIAASEQRHMDAMLNMLDKYQLADPVVGLEQGEFDHPVLSDLYKNLVSDSEVKHPVLNEPLIGGKDSPEAALYVGAWIEERDMIDILHAIANTSRADIVGVYTNLLCGSREHLRAFVRNLGTDSYQPQILYSSSEVGSEVDPAETLEYWLGDESDEVCM